MQELVKCANLNTVIKIDSIREFKLTGNKDKATKYYIL